MTTHAPPQADADYLTAILRKAEALGSGRVVAARVVHSFPTVLSHFHRLKLDYDGSAEGAPRHLYLKTGLPDSPGAAMDSGRREVAFYTDVAPTTPPGLLPRCFDGQAADGNSWHLLLEDLTDTHYIATQWPLPPTVAETEAIMRCRARFQAAWWDHPRLGDGIGHRPSDAEFDQWRDWLAKQYEVFADALGDRLSPRRRALYEKLLAEAPRLVQRIRDWRHLTLIQGDAHVWNCFLPKDGAAETARLFDWDGWRVAVGTEDLAYMIAMHWYPERRQRAEQPLLDAFHDELLANGVTGYDRRALQDDYRLSVLWQTTRPLWMRNVGISPSIWWNNLERIHLAVDDLDCRELLG
jgi:Ecdysteroid kinase-like family